MPSKIACAFHPEEFLTNFCMNKQCLLPLCPTCVKIHSVEHVMMQNIPRYEQISQLTHLVSQSIAGDIIKVEADITNLMTAQNSVVSAKQRALQSIDTFKREIIAETEVFCQGLCSKICESYRETEDFMRKTSQSLGRNAQTMHTLLSSLAGDKPMRTIIRYMGKGVREKIDQMHRQIEQLVSQSVGKSFIAVDFKSQPVKALRDLLQNLLKVQSLKQTSPKSDLIDIHQEIVSDKKQENTDYKTLMAPMTTSINPFPTETIQQTNSITHDNKRSTYRSLPHHQIQPQKSPIASIARNLHLHRNHNIYCNRTIDHTDQRTGHLSQLQGSFADAIESTPKNYHLLGTKRPLSKVQSMALTTVNRSSLENSDEKRQKLGLMLVQQKSKNRRISFNRNIKMYKENRDPGYVEPFNKLQ